MQAPIAATVAPHALPRRRCRCYRRRGGEEGEEGGEEEKEEGVEEERGEGEGEGRGEEEGTYITKT